MAVKIPDLNDVVDLGDMVINGWGDVLESRIGSATPKGLKTSGADSTHQLDTFHAAYLLATKDESEDVDGLFDKIEHALGSEVANQLNVLIFDMVILTAFRLGYRQGMRAGVVGATMAGRGKQTCVVS